MPVLPVPMIIALLLFALLTNRLVRGETHVTLLALVGICATQSAIVALVQYYGVTLLRPVQPLLATVIPAVAWFAFDRASGGIMSRRKLALHAIGPILALGFLLASPALLDLLIPLLFVLYGAAMLSRLSGGEDSLPHSRLEHGAGSVLSWRVVALSLIASALGDAVISYGLMMGQAGFLAWVPSLTSSLSLLALGALSLISAIESRHEPVTEDDETPPEFNERYKAILSALESYVETRKPHLDPDLTLARLARKLIVPAKQLSTAINRGKGENVSRYINRLRIQEACARLATGTSVTAAMLESGFNTKSNFNREFLRVTGTSPSAWVAQEGAVEWPGKMSGHSRQS